MIYYSLNLPEDEVREVTPNCLEIWTSYLITMR